MTFIKYLPTCKGEQLYFSFPDSWAVWSWKGRLPPTGKQRIAQGRSTHLVTKLSCFCKEMVQQHLKSYVDVGWYEEISLNKYSGNSKYNYLSGNKKKFEKGEKRYVWLCGSIKGRNTFHWHGDELNIYKSPSIHISNVQLE